MTHGGIKFVQLTLYFFPDQSIVGLRRHTSAHLLQCSSKIVYANLLDTPTLELLRTIMKCFHPLFLTVFFDFFSTLRNMASESTMSDNSLEVSEDNINTNDRPQVKPFAKKNVSFSNELLLMYMYIQCYGISLLQHSVKPNHIQANPRKAKSKSTAIS